jgi:hypothetical protein
MVPLAVTRRGLLHRLREQRIAQSLGAIPNDTRLLLQKLKKIGGTKKVRCCYEAGPTGYGLHRDLVAARRLSTRPSSRAARQDRLHHAAW